MIQSLSLPARRLLTVLGASAICLLAWFIFIYHLTYNSMWWDEYQSWSASRRGPIGLFSAILVDTHPPVSYLWTWLWMAWMGGSDKLFVIRMSSVVVSTLTVAFVYRIGRDWFRSHLAAAGAALFLLTSGVFVFHARLVRMYSPVVLVGVLSWLMLQRVLENKSSAVWGYAAAVALLAYTHYTSVFIVAAQFAFVLLFHRQQLRRILLAYGMAFVAFIPWIPGFLRQLETNRSLTFADNALLAGPAPGLYTSPENIINFWSTFTNQQTAFVLLLVALVITIGFRAAPALRRWLVAGLMWFFLSMTFIFAFSLVVPVYRERFVITVLPGLALVAGAAVRSLPSFWPRLATIGIIALAGAWNHARVFDNLAVIPPYRQLLETVADRFYPGDKIWYNLSYGARGSSLELSAEYHLQYDLPQLHSDDFVWDAPDDFDEPGEAPRVWDVRPEWIPMLDDVQPVLEAGRVITEEYEIREYTVRLYEAPPANQSSLNFGESFDLVVSPIPNRNYAANETFRVTSWWRSQQPVELDYSYGLFLRGADQQIIAQMDGSLATTEGPTSQWEARADYAPLALSLTLPPGLPAGEYDLLLGVYYWEDGVRLELSSEDTSRVDVSLDLARIATIEVL